VAWGASVVNKRASNDLDVEVIVMARPGRCHTEVSPGSSPIPRRPEADAVFTPLEAGNKSELRVTGVARGVTGTRILAGQTPQIFSHHAPPSMTDESATLARSAFLVRAASARHITGDRGPEQH
jgi:hypothetical protein